MARRFYVDVGHIAAAMLLRSLCWYPVAYGYSVTIPKAQGQTLPSVAIWPIYITPGRGWVRCSWPLRTPGEHFHG